MKKSLLFGVALLAACGGSDGGAPASAPPQVVAPPVVAAPIDGLYQVSETVTASSCPTIPVGSTNRDTLTVTTSGSTAIGTIASIGGSCPGQIDGDHVTWSCTVSTSQGSATLQISATFAGSGVSGTAVLGGSCQITETFSGARK